jgi:integrase
MGVYKRGGYYWYRFMWKNERIAESTKQCNEKVARNMESEHRARLTNRQKEEAAARARMGCVEIDICHECEQLFNAEKAVQKNDNIFCSSRCAVAWGKARSMPTLQQFLDDRFIPDVETTHKGKVKTVQYYRQGATMLKRSRLSDLRLDELTGEHVGWFAAEFARLSPSGINMGLRTLRRALNLGYAWGVIDKPVKVELAKGENQRDRVLSTDELAAYLDACPQPWQDAATVIADEGMRPGEVFVMRWEHVFLGDEETGLIRVVDGKSKAARRVLPITPRVHRLLRARHEAQGLPAEGWVLVSQSKCGHLEVQTAKRQHAIALTESGVVSFVPYVLRHTALTRLGKAARGDVFALAKIAGHSSITITQKYVHPEEETIGEVFSRAVEDGRRQMPTTAGPSQSVVVGGGTKLAQNRKSQKNRLLAGS